MKNSSQTSATFSYDEYLKFCEQKIIWEDIPSFYNIYKIQRSPIKHGWLLKTIFTEQIERINLSTIIFIPDEFHSWKIIESPYDHNRCR